MFSAVIFSLWISVDFNFNCLVEQTWNLFTKFILLKFTKISWFRWGYGRDGIHWGRIQHERSCLRVPAVPGGHRRGRWLWRGRRCRGIWWIIYKIINDSICIYSMTKIIYGILAVHNIPFQLIFILSVKSKVRLVPLKRVGI